MEVTRLLKNNYENNSQSRKVDKILLLNLFEFWLMRKKPKAYYKFSRYVRPFIIRKMYRSENIKDHDRKLIDEGEKEMEKHKNEINKSINRNEEQTLITKVEQIIRTSIPSAFQNYETFVKPHIHDSRKGIPREGFKEYEHGNRNSNLDNNTKAVDDDRKKNWKHKSAEQISDKMGRNETQNSKKNEKDVPSNGGRTNEKKSDSKKNMNTNMSGRSASKTNNSYRKSQLDNSKDDSNNKSKLRKHNMNEPIISSQNRPSSTRNMDRKDNSKNKNETNVRNGRNNSDDRKNPKPPPGYPVAPSGYPALPTGYPLPHTSNANQVLSGYDNPIQPNNQNYIAKINQISHLQASNSCQPCLPCSNSNIFSNGNVSKVVEKIKETVNDPDVQETAKMVQRKAMQVQKKAQKFLTSKANVLLNK